MVRITRQSTRCGIYRFYDMVAFHFTGGEHETRTIYLGQDLAAKLSTKLSEIVNDIETTPFVNSNLAPDILLEEGKDNN